METPPGSPSYEIRFEGGTLETTPTAATTKYGDSPEALSTTKPHWRVFITATNGVDWTTDPKVVALMQAAANRLK